jgi:hypothetical protein
VPEYEHARAAPRAGGIRRRQQPAPDQSRADIGHNQQRRVVIGKYPGPGHAGDTISDGRSHWHRIAASETVKIRDHP